MSVVIKTKKHDPWPMGQDRLLPENWHEVEAEVYITKDTDVPSDPLHVELRVKDHEGGKYIPLTFVEARALGTALRDLAQVIEDRERE